MLNFLIVVAVLLFCVARVRRVARALSEPMTTARRGTGFPALPMGLLILGGPALVYALMGRL